MSSGEWGAGEWGSGGWGGPSTLTLTLAGALAVRENTVRCIFSQRVYFSKILDQYDGSDPTHFTVTPIDGSTDEVGQPARAVNVIAIERPDANSAPPIAQVDVGKHLDLVLDRPLSSYPAQYLVTVTNLKNETLTDAIVSASFNFDGVYRELVKPSLETAALVRDIASPQAGGLGALATYEVAEDGDYAFDEGNVGLKKRLLRRAVTKKNGFVHLPGYGLGIMTYGKKLARLDVIGALTTDAKIQFEQEPDVAKAVVTAERNPKTPNLLRVHVAAKPKNGRSLKFTIEVPTT